MSKIKAKEHRYKVDRSVRRRDYPPSSPIKVYWWMSGSDKELYYNYVESIDYDIGRVNLLYGGWLPLESCFLTEEQALANFPDIEDKVKLDERLHSLFGSLSDIKKSIEEIREDLHV